ncbi:hypothetical protein [Polaribacter sp. L3A8]|uniref:hypothetical protein n=1 Tax=Polaribacter sp. L3A8 TaxID=2686361 RepID=UPI00131DE7A8|nr:hypothetical protein [Polaribacter sp. L3A8]
MINSSQTENQIQQVTNFKDLTSSPFQGEVNAMCWSRNLIGDFSEIVKKAPLEGNMAELTPQKLLELQLSKEGQLARTILLNDFKLLKTHGASPTINLIRCYERDDVFPSLPTDVYSFHVDRSPIPTDTFLCTYYGEASDILPNAQGTQKILIPEIRAELKKLYDGPDAGFEAFLSEFFFDLHYQAKPEAQIISLGIGHLWKLAIDHPESKILPCLHRAPKEKTGETRLMMIC